MLSLINLQLPKEIKLSGWDFHGSSKMLDWSTWLSFETQTRSVRVGAPISFRFKYIQIYEVLLKALHGNTFFFNPWKREGKERRKGWSHYLTTWHLNSICALYRQTLHLLLSKRGKSLEKWWSPSMNTTDRDQSFDILTRNQMIACLPLSPENGYINL